MFHILALATIASLVVMLYSTANGECRRMAVTYGFSGGLMLATAVDSFFIGESGFGYIGSVISIGLLSISILAVKAVFRDRRAARLGMGHATLHQI